MSGGIFSGPSALGIDLTPPKPAGGGDVPGLPGHEQMPGGGSTEAQIRACSKAWPAMYPMLTDEEQKAGMELVCAFGPPHTIDCMDKCKTAGMPPAQKWVDCSSACIKAGPSDVGPTTQSRVPPSAFIKQPPKADTITTTKTPATAQPLPTTWKPSASIPTWAWVVGAVGLAGLGWYFLKGGKKKVRRNAGHRSSGQFRRGQRVASKRSVDKKHSLRIEGTVKWVRGDLVMITTDNGEEWSLHTWDLKHVGSLRRNGKIIASSFQRYNGGVRIKRLHGSSTVTRFYVFREEDRNDASKWLIVEGFGPTPGDRKTDAIRRSGLK